MVVHFLLGTPWVAHASMGWGKAHNLHHLDISPVGFTKPRFVKGFELRTSPK